jgi:Ssp1 endopeptidase immunity protein Rap1a
MIALLVMAAAISTPYVTGNDLYADCKTSVGSRSGCTTYASAVIDGINLQREGGVTSICVPPTARRAELADMIAAYIAAHPESRKLSGAGAVAAALGQAYPCPK